jgi:hypothetical protein
MLVVYSQVDTKIFKIVFLFIHFIYLFTYLFSGTEV